MLKHTFLCGFFFGISFLFAHGNASFFSNTVPESRYLGWATAQVVRVLNMPGEWVRQKILSEDEIWNQGHNHKVRYWLGFGSGFSFLSGLVIGFLFFGFRVRFSSSPMAGSNASLANSRCEPVKTTGRYSALACGSFVAALMSVCAFGHILGYGAILLGWAAVREFRRQPMPSGRRLAWLGIVIGTITLSLWTYLLQIQPPLHAFEG